ncbi:nuclease [Mesorhizobium sp. L-8-10]|uniref:thermonuclease family protein n=1 Tax=Mesorhizobium sp. L-8-10 TaxID=2744523 RepID=UPI001927D05B|nr:thermonuclease family protein [Mesorhizobium sp. L-8-10]BCH32331.1 nuclease [Mesorhizobium sp. L-8-10]
MNRYRYGRRRVPYARARRSRLRKLLDYALTFAILGMLAVVASRLDRVETRQAAGAAVVNDGDTLTLGTERVRLRGIDAPEYNQTCMRDGTGYPCGRRSREALSRLISGRAVTCEGWERDRYGRLLGQCSAGAVDLNKEQVAAGWAIAYGGYLDEEDAARAGRLGLWAGEFDRPRDWRETHGGMIEGEHDRLGAAFNWLRALLGLL